MSGGLPKLNMGAVKDKEDKEKKEKKTMAEKARKLGRQASAKLKRGLTPRGSRVEREASFDSLDDASRPSDSLTGALGPRDSSLQGVSDSESDAVGTPMSDSAPPPLVQAPPVEHERLPQFEAAPDAGVSKSPENGFERQMSPLHHKFEAAADKELEESEPLPAPPPPALDEKDGDTHPTKHEVPHKEAGSAGATLQYTQAPPVEHERLPQFEDAGEVAAAAKAYDAAGEIVPAPEAAATQSGSDAPVKEPDVVPAPREGGGGRNKWKDIGIAVAAFALAAIAAEPALGALRRRKVEVPTRAVDVKAAKKSSWGFS